MGVFNSCIQVNERYINKMCIRILCMIKATCNGYTVYRLALKIIFLQNNMETKQYV